MGLLKKIKDKTGTIHDLGDSRVDAFETELSGAEHNVPYSPAVLGKANAIEKKIDDHAANVANPHGVTKEQLGLANVENKSSTQIRSEITKENVTAALGYTPIDESRIGAANGVASLDAGGRIPASQIPGGFDNIEEYDSLSDFPETGEEGKIYVAKDTNLTYRWTGSQYVEISPSLALGETATTAYRGDRGKAAYDHSQVSGDSTIHHTHANKELLDSYTQTEADLANAVAKVHEHGNKSVLDGITADKVTAWDSKQAALTFDDTPTSGSTNPVKSGGIKTALASKQDKLTAGKDIDISSNVISSKSSTRANMKFNGITTPETQAIVIASIKYGSMSSLRILSSDLESSYRWRFDISLHVTNDGGCNIIYTSKTENKSSLIVGRMNSCIYICIRGNYISNTSHNIVTCVTGTYLNNVTVNDNYTVVNIADLETSNVTLSHIATLNDLAAKQDKLAKSDAEITDAVDKAHSHSNKSVLDGITSDRAAAWDGKQSALTFDSAPTAGSTNPVTSDGIKTAIDAEATARSDADTALGNRITTLEGKTKLSDFTDDITTGEYSETGTAPVNGQAVASAVGAEATARANADTALQGNIDAETSARTNADTALGGRIDDVNAKGLTVKEIDGEPVLCFE